MTKIKEPLPEYSKTKSARSALIKDYFSMNLFWDESQTYLPNNKPSPVPRNARPTFKIIHPTAIATRPQKIVMIILLS